MQASVNFSTNDVLASDRADWWREVICRQYANVEITSEMTKRFNSHINIYQWESLQLSHIQSSALSLKKLPREPHLNSQDAYFAFVSLSGNYFLEQDGRRAFMNAGDITLYDATRLHETGCLDNSNEMLCFSVPRAVMKSRISVMDACTATRISGSQGVGAIASNFLRTAASQVKHLQIEEISALSACALDMLTLAVNSIKPSSYQLSRSQSASLYLVKTFIDQHLSNPTLNAQTVSIGVGLSVRYINKLFEKENTSLMRYILKCRLNKCHNDILRNPLLSISETAFRWGFNDFSHFSRVFKHQFGLSPRDIKHAES